MRGQHAVAVTPGRRGVRLTPAAPPACAEAVEAVRPRDWLIFGPGSAGTRACIPHLLVPELAAAIVASPARRLVTLNLAAESETAGLVAAGPSRRPAPVTCPACASM